MRRGGEVRTDCRHDRYGAVLIGNVVLDDDGRPRLFDLVADGGIEGEKIDLAPSGKGHGRFGFAVFLDVVDVSSLRPAPSSRGEPLSRDRKVAADIREAPEAYTPTMCISYIGRLAS